MGSEGLSHKFTIQDPTYKENSSSNHDKSSSQHSMSHTSGTHPVAVSNGPQSSSSSSSTKLKHILKINSKYRKLFKLYTLQLSHIETTINAIESLSKSNNNNEQNKLILLYKNRVNELKETIENLRKTPSEQDHTQFDQIKNDIEQLINDLKMYKIDNDKSDSGNTINSLVSFPLDVSDNDNDDETLIYF